MKKLRIFFLLCTAVLLAVPEAFAQSSSLNGMSLNGAAGLYAVPSGRIGWSKKADVGLDFGSSYNFFSQNPIAKAGISLFDWVELSGAVDFQPKTHDMSNTDGILGVKLQLPTPNTGVAVGGNIQFLTLPDRQNTAGQIYVAISYLGDFFSWPADTSMAIGYTFLEGGNKNIDFGMGFDMTLVPNVLGNFVHLVVDFSNFSYSYQALGADAWIRGSLNTGFRINISAAPALNKFKLVFDLVLLDILDSDRTIGMGFSFGLPLK
ncbi:MAG: hypothetical protein LBK27_07560 [Treponema sp.]|jgi:hypothetical protein|nr:hypothetical protein [Treponema sp.]